MQLVTATTPVIVTRALVAGMSNVVCATVTQLFATLSDADLQHIEEELKSLRIRTDVELIGALLSDMSSVHDLTKSVRVSLDHLHTSLQEMNKSLCELDTFVKKRYRYWPYGRPCAPDPKLIKAIEVAKSSLDHYFQRVTEVTSIVAAHRRG